VTPVPPNGAMFLTTVGNQTALDQTVTADGVDRTVDERDSDMGGGAVYHDNRVQVERIPLNRV
jgi:hypothetical protein